MSTRRDFMETERTPGWAHYKALVEEQIAREHTELLAIETTGKGPEAVGADYIEIKARIAGLERALGVAEDIKNEPADDL
jgi:hypothetical protein